MSDSEREERERATEPGPGRLRTVHPRHRRPRRADERGLTLVELMVVVAIIAVIAAVAITVYQDIVKKSKLSADYAVVASLRSAVAIYYGRSNGLFPASMAAVQGLVQPTPVFNCTVSPIYDNTNGKITFTATITDCP